MGDILDFSFQLLDSTRGFPHLFWPKNIPRRRWETRNLGASVVSGASISGSGAESWASAGRQPFLLPPEPVNLLCICVWFLSLFPQIWSKAPLSWPSTIFHTFSHMLLHHCSFSSERRRGNDGKTPVSLCLLCQHF